MSDDGSSSPVDEFASELRHLYNAAGRPTYRTLIAHGQMQDPPVQLNAQSLSDWLAGKSVPKASPAVRFLIVHLEARGQRRARARGEDYQARGLESWMRLRNRAWHHTHGRTNPSPARSSPPPDSSTATEDSARDEQTTVVRRHEQEAPPKPAEHLRQSARESAVPTPTARRPIRRQTRRHVLIVAVTTALTITAIQAGQPSPDPAPEGHAATPGANSRDGSERPRKDQSPSREDLLLRRCAVSLPRTADRYEALYSGPLAGMVHQTAEATTVILRSGRDIWACNLAPTHGISHMPKSVDQDPGSDALALDLQRWPSGPGRKTHIALWGGGMLPDGYKWIAFQLPNGVTLRSTTRAGYWAVHVITPAWHDITATILASVTHAGTGTAESEGVELRWVPIQGDRAVVR